jgi:hypothetical protein
MKIAETRNDILSQLYITRRPVTPAAPPNLLAEPTAA